MTKMTKMTKSYWRYIE